MKLAKKYLILSLLMIIAYYVSAQTTIQGMVMDKQSHPIIGANIYIQDSYDGTTSDYWGDFSFTTTLTGPQVLITSFLGYATAVDTVLLSGDTINLTIILREERHTLEDIVISAGSFTGGGEQSREILQPMDIVTTAGATADIAGALNTLPGTQTVGETGRLFVRGGEGYETKTFIDGMQVLGFYTPTAPNTPSRSRFMPYMFSGTSFSTGGYSAEYGQALSSALILHSKFLALEDRIDLSVMTVGGDASITKSWDSASLIAKGQYTNLQPYHSLVNQNLDWIDHPVSYEGSMAYRLKISKTGVLKAFTNINQSDFALNRPDILDAEESTYTRIQNKYRYLNAIIHEEWPDGWNIKGGVSFTSDKNQIFLNQEKIIEKGQGLHLKAVANKDFHPYFSLKLGGEHFYRTFKQDYHDPIAAFSNTFQYMDHLSSAFAEGQFMISGNLVGRLGIRMESSTLRKSRSLSPRISLGWKTSKFSQVSATFGCFRQAPQDRYLMVSNHLKDESALHYLLNYEYIQNGKTFRVEVFQKTYDDLVKNDPTQPWSLPEYNNLGFGYARGLDLFWRDRRSHSNLDYWISYSYLDSKREYGGFPDEVSPPFASKHNLSLVGKYFVNTLRTSFGMTGTFASGRPYHDPNTEAFMSAKTPAYIDLSGNASILLRQNLILHLSATNILGRDHIYSYEFSRGRNEEQQFVGRAIGPPAKRFLFVGLFWTITRDQLINQLPYL